MNRRLRTFSVALFIRLALVVMLLQNLLPLGSLLVVPSLAVAADETPAPIEETVAPEPTTNTTEVAEETTTPQPTTESEITPTPESTTNSATEPEPTASESTSEEQLLAAPAPTTSSNPGLGVEPGPDQRSETTEVIVGSTWTVEGKKATVTTVELDKMYIAPQNDQVAVTFTQLPEQPGSLTIEEIELTDEQVSSLGAYSNLAYDITSTMENGSFEYELKLPLPESIQNATVVYTESLNTLDTVDVAVVEDEQVVVNEEKDEVVVSNLDHFTVFVVTGVDDSSSCSGAIELITPVGGDECYTSLQAAIDAAISGDTIEIHTDLTIPSRVNITKSVTINGNGHTLSPNFTGPGAGNSNNAVIGIAGQNNITLTNVLIDGSGGTTLHGINVFASTNIVLNNVTSSNNDKSGIVNNGSTVTVHNVTTAGNGWHGINVDKGSAPSAGVLTVTGTSSHSDLAHIYIDNTANGSVVDSNNQYTFGHINLGGVHPNDLLYTLAPIPPCDGSTTSFDTFVNGSVNSQGGWESTGPFDQAIVSNTYGFSSFGCKSLRLSNAVTSGSFGNQTFSYSVPNEAGDAEAVNGGKSGGIRQNHFEAQFDIASTQAVQQPGMTLSISPDRGDGARMSYLRFEDQADGIHIFFDDVTTTIDPANWNETDVATISRTTPHTIKLTIDFVDGPSNDIVKVYVDDSLVHTGTTWENYYRFDNESNPLLLDESRTVDSLIFRAGGTAAPSTSGKGFLFDNVEISTSTILPTIVTIDPATTQLADGIACGVGGVLADDGLTVNITNWQDGYVLQGRYFTAGGSFGGWLDLAPWGTFSYSGDDATFFANNSGNSPAGSAGWEVRVVDASGTVVSNVDSFNYTISTDPTSAACGGMEVALCKEDADGNPLPGWKLLLSGRELVDEQELNSNSSTGVSFSPSNPGYYQLVANGTWNNGSIEQRDAFYSASGPNEGNLDPINTGVYDERIVKLVVNDAPGSLLDFQSMWGAYNPAHEYASVLESDGSPLVARIWDFPIGSFATSWYGDNNGSLNLGLYELTDAHVVETGDDGCGYIDGVGSGDYYLSELPKTGWQYAEGAGEVTVNANNNQFTIVNKSLSPEPEPQLAQVTVCKEDQNETLLAGWQVLLYNPAAIQSTVVPSNGTTVSLADIDAGDYILRADGFYTYRGTTGAEYSDAGWSKRLPSDPVYGGPFVPWVNVNTFDAPYTGYLGVMVNGDANWGEYFNPAHVYARSLSGYVGGTLALQILDDNYSDNSGEVTVALHTGYTGVTEEDGCITFDDVPYGDYQLDEIGQDGWENVSGLGEVVVEDEEVLFTIVNSTGENGGPEPTAEPTPTPEPTTSPEPTAEPTPTPSSEPTPTPTATPEPTEEPTGDVLGTSTAKSSGKASPPDCSEFTPDVPLTLAAIVTGGTVELSWNDIPQADTYVLRVLPPGGSEYGLQDISADVNSLTLTNLTLGTYTFELWGQDGCHPSPRANTTAIITTGGGTGGPPIAILPGGDEGGVPLTEGEVQGVSDELIEEAQATQGSVAGVMDEACERGVTPWIPIIFLLIMAVLAVLVEVIMRTPSLVKIAILIVITAGGIGLFYWLANCNCQQGGETLTQILAWLCKWFWVAAIIEGLFLRGFGFSFIQSEED